MRFIRVLFLVFFALTLFQDTTATPAAFCEGTKFCPDQDKWVTCDIDIPLNGFCVIKNLPNGVECIAQNSDRVQVGSVTAACDDGGLGAGCDPGDPLYWVFCDPFAF